MKKTGMLSRIPVQDIGVAFIGLGLFMAAAIGMTAITPGMYSHAEKTATSAVGASYYAQIMARCPSLQPQARAMMADHDADRAEIRRMNEYVVTARSIVGERACDVKPVDLDRHRDSMPLVL